MSNQIEYQHDGKKVWYDRNANEWRWGGSNRGFATPDKAEASIDRANGLGKNNAPKFERQKAHYWFTYGERIACEVTGQEGDDFWITTTTKTGSKRRSKVAAYALYADTPENEAKFVEYDSLSERINALIDSRAEVQNSAQQFADWLKEQETK